MLKDIYPKYVMGSCKKLDNISNNKGINSYFSMKKKVWKILIIFDIKNWLWKSNFVTFWHLPITPMLKIWVRSVDFYPKTFLILYPSLKNSTTGTAILSITHRLIHSQMDSKCATPRDPEPSFVSSIWAPPLLDIIVPQSWDLSDVVFNSSVTNFSKSVPLHV